jgi:type IV pilus assembly protein PilB
MFSLAVAPGRQPETDYQAETQIDPDTDMSPPPIRMPLGDQLVVAGLITEVQLDLARREELRHGGNLLHIIAQLGFIKPETLADFMARQAGTRSVNLNRIMVDQAVLALVPQEIGKRCVAMPIERQNGTLTVAMADPFDVNAVDTLQQYSGCSIEVVTAPERDILNCLELYYSTASDNLGETIEQVLDEKEKQAAVSLDELLGRMANKRRGCPGHPRCAPDHHPRH